MGNKILITGLPKSGKSTILEKLISNIKNKKGFLTREIRKNKERIGFKIVASSGKEGILASADFNTPYKVSKYCVDLKSFESILDELFEFNENDILYIDEIGQMELFSNKFKELVELYLNSKNLFIGTLSKVYCDSFIEKIINRRDIEIVEITPENRKIKYKEILNKIKI